MARISRVLRTILLLITACFLLSGCPEFESIEQPSSASPGEIFTVFIEARASSTGDPNVTPKPYFGICLPMGWTISGDAITCTGVYNGIITYDPNLTLEQEAMNPSPDGYYWWVGDGNEANVEGSVYSEIQIQTSGQLGLFSIDYMLGNSYNGLNQQRSNNHLIDVVDEYTPRELRIAFQGDFVFLSWVIPDNNEELVGYHVYRDGQLIDTIPDDNTEYIDEGLPDGVFYYSVSAVYEDGHEHLTPYEVKGLVFSEGTGESNDPYQIVSAEQLVYFADFPVLNDKIFILINDIDLDPNLIREAAFEGSVIPSFSGTLNGNGFTISNLTLTGKNYLGLIGKIEDGGLVQNLGVFDANITGEGDYIGIIAGRNNGAVSNSYSTGSVSGHNSVGGLVGSNIGSITSCYSTGSVSGNADVGSLVGYNQNGTITSSYSTGSVSGDDDVGGLVGFNHNGTITSSYSTGSVSGNDDVGGLVGSNYGSITSCFWDIKTSGLSRSDGGMGLTTLKMQDINTFLDADWGCLQPGAWTIDDGNDYPRLRWEGQAGEPIVAGGPCLPDYLAGTGTVEDPYLINNAEELNLIGLAQCYWNSHFKLTANVDLSIYTGIAFNKIGRERVPFTGVFDGGGHTISNFNYACVEEDDVGLFGYVAGPEAEIRDLGLIEPNVAVEAGSYIGALVGRLEQGLIRNCCVRGGVVSGDEWIGGLVGFNTGTITSCHSTGSVTGYVSVGGLVGSNGLLGSSYEGTITSCCSAGSVTGLQNVGGLAGINRDSVTTSYSTSSVTGYNNVGGLVGFNTGNITSCYSTGTVSGERDVGGLVGCGILGKITSCYSTGLVTGDSFVGGLVGYYDEILGYYDAITSSFWDIETSGLSGSDGGVGLTTAEMMDPYILGLNGFTNDPNWILDAGRDYPRLAWEGSTGEIIPEPVVDWLDGQGTEEEPYRIDTADQLIFLSKAGGLWDKHFILGADIDMDPNLPGRQIFAQAVFLVFSGVFDGNGHTIAHLTIKGRGFLGLFGQTTSEARISNIILDTVDVAGTGSWVGALVGGNKGTITSCCSTGTVNGDSTDGKYIGGLVGHNGGTVTSCYSTSSVSGHSYIGGLVGRNYDGSITSCYSTGLVSGELLLGGLVGSNRGSISTSYSTGLVSGERSVGGLVGDSSWGTITSCYSTGPVHGDSFVGGLVGRQGDSTTCTVTSSVWDIETSAQTTSACGGTGLTTVEMQTASTFLDAGWDFVGETKNGTEDIWWILEGQDYPHLWWEAVD